jgi:nitroimidazol reductase NimA-like FMN-containing flavoprotein (pyridoxamine 5'-phosphate oxidase superfamily)
LMKVTLRDRERNLVLSKDIGRLSTISANGWPHSVPVSYMYLRGRFYVPSAQSAKKVKNLKRSKRATLVIDDEHTEHGLMVECNAKILGAAKAEPFRKSMREVKSWKNDETTIVIELEPKRKASWFLK